MATAEILVEQAPVAHTWTLPKHIPELDGLRALAILLVLIHHQTFWVTPSPLRSVIERGVVGVDLFFVLSGFLITGILLDSQGRRHAARNFYVRRGLRIWPLYFAFLVASVFILRRMMPAHFAFWPYLLLVQNFVYLTSMGPALEPTWSLAVEEQFYLVWPWIVLQVRRDTVVKVCGAVLAVSPIVRFGLRLAGAQPRFLYVNTLCRLDPIAIGALIAAWVRRPEFVPEDLSRFVRGALPLGLAGLAACSAFAAAPLSDALHWSFLAITFGSVLIYALLLQGGEKLFPRILRDARLREVARISFALYLFNLPVYSIMHGNWVRRAFSWVPASYSEISLVLLSNAVLFAAAGMSWKFFESPILKLKNRLAVE